MRTGDTAGSPQTHKPGARFWQSQSYQNVSRETFWYDWDQKSYKAEDSGRSFDFLVQFQKRGGAALMA